MGKFVVNFVSQSLQQELLFFSLPFLIGATQRDLGQIGFTAIVAVAALVSTLRAALGRPPRLFALPAALRSQLPNIQILILRNILLSLN